jgi:hypothetical protein
VKEQVLASAGANETKTAIGLLLNCTFGHVFLLPMIAAPF